MNLRQLWIRLLDPIVRGHPINYTELSTQKDSANNNRKELNQQFTFSLGVFPFHSKQTFITIYVASFIQNVFLYTGTCVIATPYLLYFSSLYFLIKSRLAIFKISGKKLICTRNLFRKWLDVLFTSNFNYISVR